MRTVYSALLYWLLPFLFLRLYWRSLAAPAYGRRWRERLALYPSPPPPSVVWLHAVSLGEVESLVPLVSALLARHPSQPLLVTTTTPTGSARIKAVFQDRVAHVYLPYDTPDAITRFMRHFRPRLAVVMETELWPNLFAGCAENAIPLYLINARLTEKSVRGYRKLGFLVRPMLAHVELIATQSQQDVQRFLGIGARPGKVVNMGNVKFDLMITPDLITEGQKLKHDLFSGRFVWLLASTHEDEERQFFCDYRRLKQQIPGLLLAVAPRHPERFPIVNRLLLKEGFSVVTRSSAQPCHHDSDVYLVDSTGELKLFYAAADVAFVGGSLVAAGGHNVLEPAAIGVPVVFGPWMDNFKQIAQGLLEKNAALQGHSGADIADKVYGLYANGQQRQSLVEQGRAFVLEHQGATAKILALLSAHLPP